MLLRFPGGGQDGQNRDTENRRQTRPLRVHATGNKRNQPSGLGDPHHDDNRLPALSSVSALEGKSDGVESIRASSRHSFNWQPWHRHSRAFSQAFGTGSRTGCGRLLR